MLPVRQHASFTRRVSRLLLRTLVLAILCCSAAARSEMATAPRSGPTHPTRGTDPTELLEQQLRSGAIVLLGDTHRSDHILRFLNGLIPYLIQKKALTHLALEIGTDQQGVLDTYLETGNGLERLCLSPAIDGEGYRNFLAHLRQNLQPDPLHSRLHVSAIDVPLNGQGVNRDVYMASTLAALRKDDSEARILALVGNIHATKALTWASGDPAYFIPSRLEQALPGVRTFAVHQSVPAETPCPLRTLLSGRGQGKAARVGEHPPVAFLSAQAQVGKLQDETLFLLNLAPEARLAEGVDAVIYYEDP